MRKICKKAATALFAFIATLILASSTVYASTDTVTVTYGQTEARSILSMVNEFRTGSDAWYWNDDNKTKTTCSGLSALTYDYDLEAIAMQRAAEIAVSFSHTRPNGTSCFTAYTEYGYVSTFRGENIAKGQKSAERAFTAWLEADKDYSGQGHRRIMLSANASVIGIGHVTYNGVECWVMEVAKATNTSTPTTALDGEKTVSLSDTASTQTPGACKISNLTNTTSGIKIEWNEATNASGYKIYRKTSSTDYTLIKTITSASTVSYTDSAVKSKSGTTYTYKVVPYNGSCISESSGKGILRLSSVTISSLTNTTNGITIKWDKITGANGYYIYRRTSGGSYSMIKTITSGSTVSYTDTAVKSKNGTTYVYYVIPYFKNSSGSVTKGSYVNTKTMVRLTAVSVSSLTNSSSKKMTVKWSKNASATGYQIQYSTSSSFASGNKTVTVSGASTVSKVISSLTKGKTYYVRVRAYKTVNGTKYYSAWSSKKSVKISK